MTSQQIVDVLNDAFKTDPNAIDSLLCCRVPCNKAMLDHPTIQVLTKNQNGDFPTVGLLGLLNAISAIDGHRIWADYDTDTHCLIRFSARPIEDE